MNLGMNLQRARKRKNLSQEDVAQSLNVSRQCVSLWENDQTQPTLDNLDALSKLYEVSSAVILGQIPFPEDNPLVRGTAQVEQEKIQKMAQMRLESNRKTAKALSIVSMIEGICQFFIFVVPVLNFLVAISGETLAIVSYRINKNDRALIMIIIHAVYFFACIVATISGLWTQLF